jgi:hypothetical protein
MDEHGFTIKALDLSTWDAFAALVEAVTAAPGS